MQEIFLLLYLMRVYYFFIIANALLPILKTGIAIKPPIIPAKDSLAIEFQVGRKW